jgi:hypothetical protein
MVGGTPASSAEGTTPEMALWGNTTVGAAAKSCGEAAGRTRSSWLGIRAVSAISSAVAGSGALAIPGCGMTSVVVASGAASSISNRKTTGPARILSPVLKTWDGFRSSLTNVPLEEPLSTTTKCSPCREKAQCRRDRRESMIATSFSETRPTVNSPCSGT